MGLIKIGQAAPGEKPFFTNAHPRVGCTGFAGIEIYDLASVGVATSSDNTCPLASPIRYRETTFRRAWLAGRHEDLGR